MHIYLFTCMYCLRLTTNRNSTETEPVTLQSSGFHCLKALGTFRSVKKETLKTLIARFDWGSARPTTRVCVVCIALFELGLLDACLKPQTSRPAFQSSTGKNENYIIPSLNLWIYESIHLSIFVPIHLSIYLSIYPPIYLSIFLSIYLSMLHYCSLGWLLLAESETTICVCSCYVQSCIELGNNMSKVKHMVFQAHSLCAIRCNFHPRSQGSTKRHFLRPQGWNCFRSTAEGNRLARRLAYLSCPQLVIYTHHIPSI